ncbi:MAG: SusC/RagA family TonB-linked outer membrane protein [Chitinophagaceae bacterium]|nr:SusC/RagA family TonB-linked outer membrane protein [Chitinophagaceae bacterium]
MLQKLFQPLKAILLFTFSGLIAGNVNGQNTNRVAGLVNNAQGVVIADASVTLTNKSSGFSAGTVTDASGKFYFNNVPQGGPYSFEVSVIGYESEILSGYTIKSGDELSLLFTLKPSLVNLKEVVVVGYTSKRREEMTSAVTTLSSDKLKDVTTNDIGTMLQGKVSGLQVVSSSGAPGTGSEIRLRGISSINASQNPLYVVDGIIGGSFDPNDVETISVLKDAGATAMYGSQANGGVIIVTTKQAKTEKTRFEIKLTSGVRQPDYGKMQLMNGSQLYEYQKQFYRDYIPGETDNSYKIDLMKFYSERPLTLRDQNYSWPDAIFKNAPLQNYYFSASGKTSKADYYVGLSYYNEKGTFQNTNFNRVNLRANSKYRFSDKISLTNNINLSVSKGKSYSYMDIYYAYLNLPWDNPYDSAGKPIYVDGASPFKWWSRDKINPLHTIDHSNYPYRGMDVSYDMVFDWKLNNWLSFSSSNRLGANTSRSTQYVDRYAAGTYHDQGFLNEQASWGYGVVSNNLLRFNHVFGYKHKISGVAGYAWEGGWIENMGAQGKGLPPGLKVLDVVSGNLLVNGANSEQYISSVISQINYSYDDRYFLSASYRVDGSSAFPKSKRFGSFPAVSAGWLLSNESFMENTDAINLLKLRGSWGITGTQDIGASRYLGLYALNYQYNGNSAAIPYQSPSPNLTWEEKHQLNLGLDIGLFNRIDLTVDAYQNNTRNLLLQVPQPLSVGFEYKWDNVGEIINKGIEVSLNTRNITTKNFEWNTTFNFSMNNNKLKDLPTQLVKTGSWAISQVYRNDGNLYEFYMPKWLGVDPNTGSPLWEIINKDADGKIIGTESTNDLNKATMQEAGSALPKYIGSITSSWRYKNLSLSVNAYYLGGNKVYSNNLRFVMNDGHEPYYNQIVLPEDYTIWGKPGDIASNPSPQNSANSNLTSSRFLKDGSFFSIRNINLAYELPKHVIRHIKMEGVVISLSADNVYTFTGFLGQDPQTTIVLTSYSTPGVSDFKYPNNRQFMLNLNFRF